MLHFHTALGGAQVHSGQLELSQQPAVTRQLDCTCPSWDWIKLGKCIWVDPGVVQGREQL